MSTETNESIIMKYAGDFMHLGDLAQYNSPVDCEDFKKLSAALIFFANPIPADITVAELHTKLTELQNLADIAQGRLTDLWEAIRQARKDVRSEIHH